MILPRSSAPDVGASNRAATAPTAIPPANANKLFSFIITSVFYGLINIALFFSAYANIRKKIRNSCASESKISILN
jgi:hypothetical protein